MPLLKLPCSASGTTDKDSILTICIYKVHLLETLSYCSALQCPILYHLFAFLLYQCLHFIHLLSIWGSQLLIPVMILQSWGIGYQLLVRLLLFLDWDSLLEYFVDLHQHLWSCFSGIWLTLRYCCLLLTFNSWPSIEFGVDHSQF